MSADDRRHRSSGILLSVLVLVGCESARAPAEPSDNPDALPSGLPIPFPSGFALPSGFGVPTGVNTPTVIGAPNPVTVRVTLDGQRKATGSIGRHGGTLTAAAADTQIAMVPVSSIAGLPFSGGLGGAVQFEPDGLELFKPALFTIEPARRIPPERQIGFAYFGQGQDLYAVPSKTTSSGGMQLYLSHFSGGGGANGLAKDLAGLSPADLIARAQQLVAEAQEKARQEGSTEPLERIVAPILSAVNAQLRAAYGAGLNGDCASASQAVRALQGIRRQEILEGAIAEDAASFVDPAQYEAIRARCEEETLRRLKEACAFGDMADMQKAYVLALRASGTAGDNSQQPDTTSCVEKHWTGTITLTHVTKTKETATYSSDESTATLTETFTLGGMRDKIGLPNDYGLRFDGTVSATYAYDASSELHTPMPLCGPWGNGTSTTRQSGTLSQGSMTMEMFVMNDDVEIAANSDATFEAPGETSMTGMRRHNDCNAPEVINDPPMKISTTIGVEPVEERDHFVPDTNRMEIRGQYPPRNKPAAGNQSETLTITWNLVRK
jgi:hypothetical protein